MARGGLVGAVHPVGVHRVGAEIAQVAVPHLVGELGQLDAVELAPARLVEQAQLHPGGVRGEEREVDPEPVPGGAQGVGQAFRDAILDRHVG